MVIRIILIFLCLGILSTVSGCYVDPSPSPYGNLVPYWVAGPHEASQGPDYEREIDKEVEQYRRRRSAQEREQERAHQQWEQERARERDPRWEWQR
jgi:hypothetical protein